jgi:hypothetical protein
MIHMWTLWRLGPGSSGERREALKWKYWGSRMLDLYEELENERPYGSWDVWVERNSKDRRVMMDTIIGVFIAVLHWST